MEYLYWIYHYDARGSATNLVGAKNGSLYRAEENIYDAFGNKEEEIKQSTSSVVNDIKFTGATLDNSGTYYLGSRHYDPNTGRFLQQDTFKGEAYSPWTQNLYTYTSNNPVNYVDPTGHSFKEIGIVVGAVIGLVCGGKKGAKAGVKIGGAVGEAVDKALEFNKSANTTKTASNRGKGYSSREEAIKGMNISLRTSADEVGRAVEFGAFVYQANDGMYYVSNMIHSNIRVTDVQVRNEMRELGLLSSDGKSLVELVAFSHTHTYYDERIDLNYGETDRIGKRYITGSRGTANNSTNEKPKGDTVYTEYGSFEDWDCINTKSLGSNVKIQSFTILVPIGGPKGSWYEETKSFWR